MKTLEGFWALMRGVMTAGCVCHIYPNVVMGKNVTVYPGAVIGRPAQTTGVARRVVFTGPTEIGDGAIVGANAVIYAGARIGERTMICDTACIRENVTIGQDCLIAQGVTVNVNASIGNRTKIMDNTHITGDTYIGPDVFIGMLVTMANDNSIGKEHQNRPPHIRQHVRIGQGAILLPGVRILAGAVVGAGAVVTRDVAEGSVMMGVPAREVTKHGT